MESSYESKEKTSDRLLIKILEERRLYLGVIFMSSNMAIEEQLILKLSKLNLCESDIKEATIALTESQINWGNFYDFIINHKIGSLIYRNFCKYGFPINKRWSHVLEVYTVGNRLRNKHRYDTVTPVLNDLYDSGIKCIALKGAILNHTLYDDYGLRQSNDFDVLIQEKDISRTVEIMNKYGFIQSSKGTRSNKLEPASRREKAFYRMSTHEIVPLILESDNPFNKFIEIDVQFDIFSHAKNMRVDFPIKNLFDSAEELEINQGRIKCFTLKPEYNLLQLCSHIYQDNTMIQNIVKSKDHILRDFIDVHEFILKNINEINWEYFSTEICKYHLNDIVYFVIHHVHEIFGKILPKSFIEKIRPNDVSYLNMYGFEETTRYNWKKPFLNRLFDLNRKNEMNEIDPSNLIESNKFHEIYKGKM